jgi:ATP-dependent RNA helicase DeaD
LGLSAPVLAALDRLGYVEPTPIQAESIPPLLAGRDLLGTAQTGTGKTAAFALPLLCRLDPARRAPQVLVLAPTRELALQVAEAFRGYASELAGIEVLPIYGGQSMGVQLKALQRGPQVVVGTPGRVMDHLRRGSLTLEGLRTVVLDEADEMLRMGFLEDVQWILEHTPAERQVALFSATMPAPIRQVADAHLRDPARVSIASRTTTVERVEQKYWLVAGASKLDALTRILEAEPHDGVIVFVRTRAASERLAEGLVQRGFAAAAINGDATQAQREATIARLKSGAVDLLVATDVAARGIDVARISHVVNFDMPVDTEAYVHRIGRTGRAGRAGTAILFVAARERRLLAAIERATRQKMTALELPSKAEIERRRAARFKTELGRVMAEEPLRPSELLLREFLAEHPDADLHNVAAALLWMARRGPASALPPTPTRAPEAATPPVEASGSTERERPPAPRAARPTERGTKTPDAEAPARATRAPRSRERTERTPELELYRLAVGRVHGVRTGDIVGAIANEAELDSRYIGRVRIHEDHSTVELPVGMPRELQQHLRRTRIRNVPLELRRADPETGEGDATARPAPRERKGSPARAPGAKTARDGSRGKPKRSRP